jgi:hypothetical protein
LAVLETKMTRKVIRLQISEYVVLQIMGHLQSARDAGYDDPEVLRFLRRLEKMNLKRLETRAKKG